MRFIILIVVLAILAFIAYWLLYLGGGELIAAWTKHLMPRSTP